MTISQKSNKSHLEDSFDGAIVLFLLSTEKQAHNQQEQAEDGHAHPDHLTYAREHWDRGLKGFGILRAG